VYANYVLALYSDYALSSFTLTDAETDLNSAWIYWGQPNDHECLRRVMMSVAHIIDAANWILSIDEAGFHKNNLYYTQVLNWEFSIEEFPEVTYKSIAEAWFANDFEGRAVTIACIDRMRQLIWDEPFDVVWAARPEERGIE